MITPPSHEAAVESYLAKLKTVLMSPDHGDDSWPTISASQLGEMNELVEEMLSLKWGADGDGDKPVRLVMHDRRTHHLVWRIPLRKGSADESLKDEERRLLGNMRTITGALSSYTEELRHIEARLNELAKLEVSIAAAFPIFLVRYSKSDDWLANAHAHDQPVSLHLSEEAASAFEPPAGVRKGQTFLRWAVPHTFGNPADNFAEYRKQVAASCESILPYYRVREELNLQSRNPKEVTS